MPDARGADRVPAADRGATTIADRVLAKIASRAADEALTAQGGVPEAARAPRATVVKHHDRAHVRVVLELAYPSDIGARCAAVRQWVTWRLQELTGQTVPDVAVHVERLHPTHRHGAPR
ncbi:Asp23/Gls24 family envelope stress response protein [Streptomyces sp. TRM64462]|uniref:Asp23/Gls24 family envelope stress response protein n=1 Tax=Streptomyces sp. TRM64462 TaxID=2741726 RepID=UPI001586B973|nr:Asp23/Gls24 family envelope stress response protein [Streptomyces sp. TRM64462]